MFDTLIKLILISLFIFTPIALGSIEIWAFSSMELGILLVIILATIGRLFSPPSAIRHPQFAIRNSQSKILLILLSLFLAFILFQTIPLPSGMIKILSPKTYELRHQLSPANILSPLAHSPSPVFIDQIDQMTRQTIRPDRPEDQIDQKTRQTRRPDRPDDQIDQKTRQTILSHSPSPIYYPISFLPFATLIEFFKWFTLAGFFIFLLHGNLLDNAQGIAKKFIIVVMLVGIVESFYGMLEFFSGHRHILYLDGPGLVSSVTGTFINRNSFAGYLLMVIPLSMGFLFSREAGQTVRFRGWRHRLSSLDGKTFLIGFGVILMILGLIFSASRMGIVSLLISFSLVSLLFRNPHTGQRFSKTPLLIFGLALLWAAWLGLDAIISRFFTASEDFKMRWLIWENTFQIFKDFPLLGSGIGTFAQIFPMYRSFHIRGLVTHAENDFLQLASEAGLIGISLLFILFIFLLYNASSGIRSLSPGEPQRYIALGGLVGILALMLHSIVERNIQVPANAFLFTFLWALSLRIGIASRTAHALVPAK
jgi:O-antigen ligase